MFENCPNNFTSKLSSPEKLLFDKLQENGDEIEFEKKSCKLQNSLRDNFDHPIQRSSSHRGDIFEKYNFFGYRFVEAQKTKKKKKKKKEVPTTKTDIFENTPKVERSCNYLLPSGLSPPDFSGMKIDFQI